MKEGVFETSSLSCLEDGELCEKFQRFLSNLDLNNLWERTEKENVLCWDHFVLRLFCIEILLLLVHVSFFGETRGMLQYYQRVPVRFPLGFDSGCKRTDHE